MPVNRNIHITTNNRRGRCPQRPAIEPHTLHSNEANRRHCTNRAVPFLMPENAKYPPMSGRRLGIRKRRGRCSQRPVGRRPIWNDNSYIFLNVA